MFNTKTFSLQIDSMVADHGSSYIDAICAFCAENNMEIETAAKLVNTKIKKSLAREASDLNMLKHKNTQKLPV